MNRRNLKLLADFLSTRVVDDKFDMCSYSSLDRPPVDVDKIDCGTTACAVGWGPVVPGLSSLALHETWGDYCFRVFEVRFFTTLWDFLFSGLWYNVDNTPRGAAARIYAMLADENPDDLFNINLPLCAWDKTTYAAYLPK